MPAKKPPISSTQRTANKLLDLETNARFWAQTGYKVGQKLNMQDPTDKAMAKVWLDIHAKVIAEDKRGKLVLTYNKPVVQQNLATAADAHDATVAHLENGDHAAAMDAHAAGADATALAAAHQPASVSPEVAHNAAAEASLAADQPPPPPLDLHPDHPARTAPGARPAVDPSVINPTLDAQSVPVFSDYQPPTSAEDHLAIAQAQASPKKAAEVHHVATNVPAPSSSMPTEKINAIRAEARTRAKARGGFIGIAMMPDGSWHEEPFGSIDAALGWYGTLTNEPSSFVYSATFSPNDPEPSEEMFGIQSYEIPVKVTLDAPPAPPAKITSNLGPIAAVSAVAVTAAAAVFAGRRKKGR